MRRDADALHIDGCALGQGSIRSTGGFRITIARYYTHRDKAGSKLVERTELGWQVRSSEPDIRHKRRVLKYGRLYVLHSIVVAAEELKKK